MSGRKVLIVEDDPSIAKGLALNFKIEGYSSVVAEDGEGALGLLHSARPDLILLDISLPKLSGLEVLSKLRGAGDHTPVIVLSARQDEFDKVAALRLGADDYVTKPFALAELLARCDAVLRRATKEPPAAATGWTIDLDTRQVLRGGSEVPLTKLEFDLLAYLVKNPAKVLSRDHLLREVWGAQAGSPRTVDNFVAQLRGKLEEDPERPKQFVTVRGSGYRFDP